MPMKSTSLPQILAIIIVIASSYCLKAFAETEAAGETIDAPTQGMDAVKAEEANTEPTPRVLQQAIIDELSDPQQVHWLTTDDGEFLALYQKAYTPKPLGSLIVLHDNNQNANWPGVVQQLRLKLPQVKWGVLSLSVPTFNPPKTNGSADKDVQNTEEVAPQDLAENETGDLNDAAVDEANPDPSGTPDNADSTNSNMIEPSFPDEPQPTETEAFDQFAEEFANRLQAGFDFLAEQGSKGPTVIVAVGESAGWISHSLDNALQGSDLKGLVIIEGRKPNTTTALALTESLPKLQFQLLDITDSRGEAMIQAKKRSRALKQLGNTNYAWATQAKPLAAGVNPVITRIRGWLRRHFEPTKVPGSRTY